MEQLSLFNESQITEKVIPKEIISPLESNKKVNSKEFRVQQERFSKYVWAIQREHQCSWFEARELFFTHRKSQDPIKLCFSEDFPN